MSFGLVVKVWTLGGRSFQHTKPPLPMAFNVLMECLIFYAYMYVYLCCSSLDQMIWALFFKRHIPFVIPHEGKQYVISACLAT